MTFSKRNKGGALSVQQIVQKPRRLGIRLSRQTVEILLEPFRTNELIVSNMAFFLAIGIPTADFTVSLKQLDVQAGAIASQAHRVCNQAQFVVGSLSSSPSVSSM